jgi:hypothetical protein
MNPGDAKLGVAVTVIVPADSDPSHVSLTVTGKLPAD